MARFEQVTVDSGKRVVVELSPAEAAQLIAALADSLVRTFGGGAAFNLPLYPLDARDPHTLQTLTLYVKPAL